MVFEPGFDGLLPGASAGKNEPAPAPAGALCLMGIVVAELKQN